MRHTKVKAANIVLWPVLASHLRRIIAWRSLCDWGFQRSRWKRQWRLRKITRKEGCGNINNNGHRFLCEPDRSCHHLIASGRTRSNLKGTMRSDHQLLMVTFAIKLRKTKIKEDRVRRIDIAELKVAQTKAGFQLVFRNRFQTLEEESVEPELSSFHQKVRVAGEKILRLKKRK